MELLLANCTLGSDGVGWAEGDGRLRSCGERFVLSYLQSLPCWPGVQNWLAAIPMRWLKWSLICQVWMFDYVCIVRSLEKWHVVCKLSHRLQESYSQHRLKLSRIENARNPTQSICHSEQCCNDSNNDSTSNNDFTIFHLSISVESQLHAICVFR